MRRDWDYVEFADYQADMKESTERATFVIGEMRKRAEQAEKLLAEIVLSTGNVKVPIHNLHDPRRQIEVTTWRNEADLTLEVTARRVA